MQKISPIVIQNSVFLKNARKSPDILTRLIRAPCKRLMMMISLAAV